MTTEKGLVLFCPLTDFFFLLFIVASKQTNKKANVSRKVKSYVLKLVHYISTIESYTITIVLPYCLTML